VDEWKVVKVKEVNDLIVIEDIQGHRVAYAKVVDNFDTDDEEVVGIAITLKALKRFYPECSEKLLKYLLTECLNDGNIYDSFGSFVESRLFGDENIVYDDGCYYLRSELKKEDHNE